MTEPIQASELKFQIPKRMKYRNVKTVIDGITFDSKKEANYYGKLKILQKAGEVVSFQRQVRYDFEVNKISLGFYKLDFLVNWASGKVQFVDVKGVKTPVYQLKKKLMKAIYGIDIFEV